MEKAVSETVCLIFNHEGYSLSSSVNGYYYSDGEEAIGPYSLDDILSFLDDGQLDPRTQVCEEGSSDWISLSLLKSLANRVSQFSPELQHPSASDIQAVLEPSEVQEVTGIGKIVVVSVVALFLIIAGVGIGIKYATKAQSEDTTAALKSMSTASPVAATSSSFDSTPVPVIISQKIELRGSVFIATKGGDNVKLGLVTVSLYRFNDVREFFSKRTQEISDLIPGLEAQLVAAQKKTDAIYAVKEKAEDNASHVSYDDPSYKAATQVSDDAERAWDDSLSNVSEIRGKLEKLKSGGNFLKGFDAVPIVQGKTDADGRFSVDLPRSGNYVAIASATREIVDDVEVYYWVVQVPIERAGEVSLMLSNDNMSSSGNPASLITTGD